MRGVEGAFDVSPLSYPSVGIITFIIIRSRSEVNESIAYIILYSGKFKMKQQTTITLDTPVILLNSFCFFCRTWS